MSRWMTRGWPGGAPAGGETAVEERTGVSAITCKLHGVLTEGTAKFAEDSSSNRSSTLAGQESGLGVM